MPAPVNPNSIRQNYHRTTTLIRHDKEAYIKYLAEKTGKTQGEIFSDMIELFQKNELGEAVNEHYLNDLRELVESLRDSLKKFVHNELFASFYKANKEYHEKSERNQRIQIAMLADILSKLIDEPPAKIINDYKMQDKKMLEMIAEKKSTERN